MNIIDKWDYKAISVLANDYSAFDIADHLADHMPEYPGGAEMLQLELMECYT